MVIKYNNIEYLYIGDHPEHPVVVLQTPDDTYIDVTIGKWQEMINQYQSNCPHSNIESKFWDMPDNSHHEMKCNDCGLLCNLSGEELDNYGDETHYRCMKWEEVSK